MDKNPLVSIVIPVYNGSNYLKEAIDSAINQTYRNCEIIVVNDGSNDDGETERIAFSYGDRIRYFYKGNAGVATALNLGIRNMKGEYFSWLSHDDVYYPNKIQAEMDALSCEKDKTKTVLCDYDYWVMSNNSCFKTNYTRYYKEDELTNSIFTVIQFPIHMCCALIHKSQFERVGLFDENLRCANDIQYAYRLLKNQRSVWVPESLYKVRVHKEADTIRYSSKLDTEMAEVYQNMLDDTTDEELKAVFGDAKRGVAKFCEHLFASNQMEKLKLMEKRLEKYNSSEDIDISTLVLNELCKEIRDREKIDIVIYGAGRYGKRMQYELEMHKIHIGGYIDSNKNKVGNIINGVICKSLSDYENKKDSALIIVALRQADSICDELQKKGFCYVKTRQQVDSIINRANKSKEKMI